MLECKDLKKVFKEGKNTQEVIKGVNLNIHSNDLITIMGKSGSGKTTLLNCISLLSDISDGQILIDGQEIDLRKKKEVEKIRQKKIGMVFQNANLISCLTTLDNLIIAIHKNIPYSEKKKIALEMLERVGLKNKYKARVSTLSGGEKQRVAILRALINEPEVVMCDEPTGALDEKTSKETMNFLIEMCNSFKSALVIVTHDGLIGNIGKRQFVMEEGILYEI